MIFKVINPNVLAIIGSYSSSINLQDQYGGEWAIYPHLAVPEQLDPDCVKAELNESQEIILVEDTDLTASKVLVTKAEQIANLNNQTWNTIINEAKSVYGFTSSDRNEASILILATHSTYDTMASTPSAYVGDIFPDEATVLAYAQPKLAASLAFGKWRLGILAQEAAQKAIIEGS